MNTTIAVDEIPTLDHDDWMAVAAAELERLVAALEDLTPDDWTRPTPCTGWDVRAMVGHLLGMMELGADRAELQRQVGAATRRLEAEGGYRIDHLTALQVEEHAHLDPGQVIDAVRAAAPRAVAGRAAWTAEERQATYAPGPPFGEDWTRGYLFDVIHTRDPWLHRVVDLSTATGRPPTLTAEHDGRIVADVVAEWARRHDQPFRLTLAGRAGGTFAHGEDGEHLEVDAIDFCRILSGRAPGDGLLAVGVPF